MRILCALNAGAGLACVIFLKRSVQASQDSHAEEPSLPLGQQDGSHAWLCPPFTRNPRLPSMRPPRSFQYLYCGDSLIQTRQRAPEGSSVVVPRPTGAATRMSYGSVVSMLAAWTLAATSSAANGGALCALLKRAPKTSLASRNEMCPSTNVPTNLSSLGASTAASQLRQRLAFKLHKACWAGLVLQCIRVVPHARCLHPRSPDE